MPKVYNSVQCKNKLRKVCPKYVPKYCVNMIFHRCFNFILNHIVLCFMVEGNIHKLNEKCIGHFLAINLFSAGNLTSQQFINIILTNRDCRHPTLMHTETTVSDLDWCLIILSGDVDYSTTPKNGSMIIQTFQVLP